MTEGESASKAATKVHGAFDVTAPEGVRAL
jgi:hypothetical protein